MRVNELSVMVDFTREIRVALVGRLEDDLGGQNIISVSMRAMPLGFAPYLGAIGEFMVGEVDLSEGSFSDQSPKSIVADRLEIFCREFTTT